MTSLSDSSATTLPTRQQPFAFAGQEWIADLDRVLYWPAQQTLLVADLHLEKGSFYASRSWGLAPLDTVATLERLARAIQRFSPRRVVCLGDSFHDGRAGERLTEKDREQLNALTSTCEWIWIEGNHDPQLPDGIGGQRMPSLAIADVVFCHEGDTRPTYQISGHFHPKVALTARGRRLWQSCFVVGRYHLILPSFGAYTGGLSVTHPAISRLTGSDPTLFIVGKNRLHVLALDPS